MTIRPVHVEGALTLEQYRQLEPELTRPLCDGPIGANPTRRANDAAASSAFDEPDRPATRPGWRATGPRQPLHDPDIRLGRALTEQGRKATRGAQKAVYRSATPSEPSAPPKTTQGKYPPVTNGDDTA